MSSHPDIENDADDAEVVEPSEDRAALPVPALRGPVTVHLAPLPPGRAAALAATSFVAGAATVAVVARRRARPSRRRRRKGAIGEIVSSSSFLVDVHLIRRD